jgi:ATP-dependent Clp protease adaptor protein ClpS
MPTAAAPTGLLSVVNGQRHCVVLSAQTGAPAAGPAKDRAAFRTFHLRRTQTHPPTQSPNPKAGQAAERPADVGVIERAGWDADRDSSGGVATLPKPDAGDGAATGGAGSAGGNYRLLLLDAPAHTERAVVAGITRVVAGVDEPRARNCFNTSRQLGLALVTSCLKEHAEFYRQQLYLYGLKTAIEPDTSTA